MTADRFYPSSKTCSGCGAVNEAAAAMELAESSGRTALGKIILVP